MIQNSTGIFQKTVLGKDGDEFKGHQSQIISEYTIMAMESDSIYPYGK